MTRLASWRGPKGGLAIAGLVVVLGLVVLGLLSGGNSDGDGDRSPYPGDPAVFQLGQEHVTHEGWRITVHGATRRDGRALVDMTACAGASPGATPLRLDRLAVRMALRLQGREFADWVVEHGVEPSLDKQEELPAGACRRGLLTFDAPEGERLVHVGLLRGGQLLAYWPLSG